MLLHPTKPYARKLISLSLTVLLCLCMTPTVPLASPALAAGKTVESPQERFIPLIPPGSAYQQTNFVSDIPGLAPIQDPLLVNPWGITLRGTSPFWVANNGTSTSTLYRGDVSGSPLVKNPGLSFVTVPGGLPTGVIGNSTTDFTLTPCAVASCPAAFIFASITGNIVGWNPNAAAAGSITGIIAASHPGHVYTGLANGSNSGGNRLYAADFANGNIDVYDGSYALTTTTGGFNDPTIPTTVGNTFHPFNIQNIGGSLYVTYAKVGADGKDEEGVGNGFVRRFNTDGVRDLTFGINNGELNSPWGIAIAPASFGIFNSALLIGNFGEGNPSIHAYNPTTGAFLGTLQNEAGVGIEIDELWGLQFGNGPAGAGGDPGTLYFTAGTAEEEHGLFGSLKPTTASATSLIQFATDDFAIGEGNGHIDITVTRAGDVSGAASINFNTFDESQPGHASQKSDYEIALGNLTFNPGETSKTFRILLVDDNFTEGDEVIDLAISNPTGVGVGLGSPNLAEVKIIDNDQGTPALARVAAGADPAAIQSAVDAFRADLGTNNGVGGSFASGRREINWDGVPDASSAPNSLPANFFNSNSPRGAVFSTAGTGFQVSANAVNPTSTPVRFGNLNVNYSATFQTFSAQRLFTAIGSNVTDVSFFIPGTTTPATVSGFGSVFTDVDNAASTKIQYFDGDNSLIAEQIVPPANGGLSFVGLSFPDRRVGHVTILSGNVAPGPDDAPPASDVVVMDDFIYGEPQVLVPSINPIDDATFFVRQQYLDFLNREPDAPGLAFWVNEITSCGSDAACIEVKRINVSAAFFLSIEFQRTGQEAYLTHRAAFGPSVVGSPGPVLYGTFERDTQALQKDFVFLQPGADAQLEANTRAYFNEFVTRPEFVSKYPASLTNAQYVDNLLTSAGLSTSNFIVKLTNSQENPPTNPTTTGGARRPASFGTATFSLNAAETAMTFTASITNLDFTGSQTADTNDNLANAHIHAAPSVTPGVNGPVVWGFFGTPFNDNNPNDQVVTPFVSGVGGTISGKWDTPEGNNTTLTAQLPNIKEGHAYINFHTTQFGGGEIRGNFPAMTSFRDSLVAGLNGATETRATVLRKVAEFPFLQQREVNAAFVFMEYAGYLRRDADTSGFNFWLGKLNEFNGNFVNAEMVKAFLASGEYRQRFGPM
jgi:uncharacterized protein (TIGR03118 family)